MNDAHQHEDQHQHQHGQLAALRPTEQIATVDRLDVLRVLDGADAPATIRAYRSDLADWSRWCVEHGHDASALDPLVVVLYFGALEQAGFKPSTIARRLTALSRAARTSNRVAPSDSELVRVAMRAIRRRAAHQPTLRPREAPPLLPGLIRVAMPRLLASSLPLLTRLRNRALILVGFAAGLRRSELESLQWEDVLDHPEGRLLRLWSTKTARDGRDVVVGVPRAPAHGDLMFCPVAALVDLSRHRFGAAAPTGPVFDCCSATINRVVKDFVALSGESPDRYSAHSLRAGCCTAASTAGIDLATWMRHSRHKSATIAAGYARPQDAMGNRAALALVDALTKLP
jgi:integrase